MKKGKKDDKNKIKRKIRKSEIRSRKKKK